MNKTFIKTKPLISLLIASSILTGLPAVVYANSYKNEEIRLEDMRKEKQDIIIECFSLINSIRIENNLEPLTWVEELEDETYLRASEASIKWSHTRPSGQAWYTVNPSLMDGENLATGYNTARTVVDGWMNSQTHRDNILYKGFTGMSIMIYENEKGVYYFSTEFTRNSNYKISKNKEGIYNFFKDASYNIEANNYLNAFLHESDVCSSDNTSAYYSEVYANQLDKSILHFNPNLDDSKISQDEFSREIQTLVFEKINELRVKEKLPIYMESSYLSSIGTIRAEECSIKWDHIRPNSNQHGYELIEPSFSRTNGENLFTITLFDSEIPGENITAEYLANECINGWWNSNTHHKLMMSKNFNSIGIGVYFNEVNRKYTIAAMFGLKE